MNSYIILLLLACAEGFAPLAQSISTTGKDARSNLIVASSYCRNKPIIIFAVSEDSNERGDDTLDSVDDYDFERGFQERLMKEGGETGVNEGC